MPGNTLKFLVLVLVLAACGSPSPTPLPTAIPNAVSQQQPIGEPGGYQVLLESEVLTVGPNRFAIGILGGDGFVKNAALNLTFFDLTEGQNAVGTVPAVYRDGPDGVVGLYTAEMSFPKAGSWGVAIVGKTVDGKTINQNVGFDVLVSSPELAVGQKAPAAKSPTLDDVKGDFTKLTSATKPNPAFYRLSLDQALVNGKPTLVQFSTPAFCTSRLCAPAYDVLQQVYPSYADKLNVIHVEVYTDLPNPNLSKPHLAGVMIAWGLTTEPWTYLLDKYGIVVWRIEGLVMADEIQAAVDRLLKAS